MITLTRRQVRGLRAIFRRSTLGITHRGAVAPVFLSATAGQVSARYRDADLAVAQVVPAASPAATGAVPVPLDALADLEGRDETPLTFEAAAPDRTVVRWTDRGIPQAREYPVPPGATPGAFPAAPATWAEVPGDLIDALVEASATAAPDDNSRYALGCLLLRSGPDGHEVVATDGRQVLVRAGFRFPWADDLLIRRAPIWAARDLPRDQVWAIGRTDTHFALRSDPFLILVRIQADLRYPRVEQIFPDPAAATARLRIDPADARFLAESLGRLPGAAAPHAPVTIDLNGHVAVRAAGDPAGAAATELILSRSTSTGTPVRFGSDRTFLARALRLGCADVEVVDPKSPIVCRSGRLLYAWQPLNADSVVEPDAALTRIESPPEPAPQQPLEPPAQAARTLPPPDRTRPAAPKAEATPDPTPSGLAALIREAESLHEALGAARTRSQGLIVALRRQRKQARLMAATLQTLRQLRLQEVAE